LTGHGLACDLYHPDAPTAALGEIGWMRRSFARKVAGAILPSVAHLWPTCGLRHIRGRNAGYMTYLNREPPGKGAKL
jgi:hypothetical protein